MSPPRYEVLGLIALGGMGAVYRVKDTSSGEVLALKRLNRQALSDRRTVEAFEREYQVLSGLSHPRIIRVFEYGRDAEGPYYTMELVDGMDMAEAAPLPYRRCCLFLRDVAASLALLHARRLVHRDLSAANVRATSSGHCKLLDFGTLAPFGFTGPAAGTPPFIAPEALRAGVIDHRADLFALGALAYWMLTAQHAFPAQRLEDLNPLWRLPPPPPSSLRPGIPKELDALVLSLLSLDPLARPTSAAEVIAMLEVIGELPAESAADAARLAQSFLATPRFVGRKRELSELSRRLEGAFAGNGSAVRIEAIAGMGRTRLLDELLLRAQVKGASVLRVDGASQRQPLAVARALALRLLDAHPDVVHALSQEDRTALAALGGELRGRLFAAHDERKKAPRGGDRLAPESLCSWFDKVSRERPLLVAIDDVEFADEASFGLLVGLSRLAARSRILVVVTERTRSEPSPAVGLRALRAQCESMALTGLSAEETLELTRSVFGDARNAPRFAEWMQERTAGSALHFVEVARQLAAKGIASYVGGAWVLPPERPDSEPPEGLDVALDVRLRRLSGAARELAECLALVRARRPTLELCRLLVDGDERSKVLSLLDELERFGVLFADQDGHRWSSVALSQVLLRGMSPERRARNHGRLGAALLALPQLDPMTEIEGGFHLIQGGDELAGADRIAAVTAADSARFQLLSNLSHLGAAAEAALHVYERRGVPEYRRLPLFTALAYAAYYEDRRWGDLYGDRALRALSEACGLATARRLAPFMGPALGLGVGITTAFLRFNASRDRHANQSFAGCFTGMLGGVTALAGAACLSLDSPRVRRAADVLSPLALLPEKAAPVGVYRFCLVLAELGREEPARVTRELSTLLQRFENPDYYSTLPDDVRRLFAAGLHFALGVYATLSEEALVLARTADSLDASGVQLYRMIASQLRALHHVNRGELGAAEKHREMVELHAAHIGSAWQAELWEGGALFAVYANTGDVSGMMRIAEQLPFLSSAVPGAALYPRLARLALRVLRSERGAASALAADPDVTSAPRSFVGWSTCQGLLARAYNQDGEHARAKAVCERALAHVLPEDRRYVMLFLLVHLELAHARSGLGDVEGALRLLDELLAIPATSGNALVRGLLHEARAVVCLRAGRAEDYAHGVAEVERLLRPTGAPALIAKCERLVARGLDHSHTRIVTADERGDQIVTVSASEFRG